MSRPPETLTPAQRAELSALPKLTQLPPEKLVSVTHRQLSLMSTVPLGSVSAAMARAGLRPAIENSTVFRAGELRAFCEQASQETAKRLALAVVSGPIDKLADPKAAADAFLAQLLAQARQP